LPGSPGAGVGVVALAVPLLAGAVAAVLVRRLCGRTWSPDLRSWRDGLEVSGLVGVVVGTAVGVLAALASGSAGPGRMTEVGPDWWAVAPVTGLETAAVVSVALLALRRRG
ncbi:MAG TPA: DUF6350 family protein, partial [Actinomycetes bacterium]